MVIHFEKVNLSHTKIIFNWLQVRHIQEFWDNTPEHFEDILNFADGRITPSNYCDGKFIY